MPMRTEAARRMRLHRRRGKRGLDPTRPGSSVPLLPSRGASTKTHGLAASTQEASTMPSPGTSSWSHTCPVGSSFPVLAPPGSRNSSLMGAGRAGDAVDLQIAVGGQRHRPSTGKRATMIFDVLVLWMRTTASPLRRRGHEAFLDGERADRRGHVPAIAAVVDRGVAHGDLRERVVDIGIRPARRPDDADLRERGDAAAHAVELATVGIRRAHDLQEDRIPALAIGREIVLRGT